MSGIVKVFTIQQSVTYTVADPGFPGGGVDLLGGRGTPMRALFGKNACKNKRIGSRGGASTRHAPLDPPVLYCEDITMLDYAQNNRQYIFVSDEWRSGSLSVPHNLGANLPLNSD